MPLSRYCKIYRKPEDQKQVMLFSTLTTAVADVASEVLQDIEKDNLSKSEKKTLTDLGFLVKNHESEKRGLLRYIDDVNAENNVFIAIVVLNLDCNLGCKYCYEGKRKGKHALSADTAHDFADFVESGILNNKDALNLVFYGGEPLLSVDTIIRISKSMRSIVKKQGIEFSFSFITNGTLLTPQVVKKLKPFGLRAASVTLDGPKEVHDAFRPFKTGKGSFDIIVKNIKNVSSLIDVHIGGNYTQDRYREFPRLLDYLIESGLTPDKISSIKFDPVFQESNEFAPPDFHDGCMSINEPWLVEAAIFLREEILKRGFRTQLIGPVVCAVERPDNLVVNYDGALYKCPGLVGRKNFCVGSVKTGIRDHRATHCLDNWKNDECLACAYLPLCFGGCRYMKLLRDNDMQGLDCKKGFYDKTLEAFVRQDVTYAEQG
ncbi:MAG: geopeptide radical SAM maturase [Nitrospiraceae bacterium]|nr:geopeptide radical SAM maturase [Nitrospiraceae bacterium]